MRDFNDYLSIKMLKSGEWDMSHLETPKMQDFNVIFRKKRYHFDATKAHPIKWYPWIDWNWFNPFEMIRYIGVRRMHRTGLLVYKEPEEGAIAEPIHVSETTPERLEVFGPAAVKVQNQSPNFTRYQRHQKFDKRGASSGWMVYALVGLVILLAVLFFTGHLQ